MNLREYKAMITAINQLHNDKDRLELLAVLINRMGVDEE